MDDLDAAVRAHCERFNAAQRGGDWAPFVDTFADHSRLAFTNVAVGPFTGRPAILAAYESNPPDDTMEILAVEPVAPDTASARFRWHAGGLGTMVVRFADGFVADVEVTFG
jgi:hypothetical protein